MSAQRRPRERAVGRLGETPHQAQQRLLKFEASQKVNGLRRRIRATSPEHGRALDVLHESLREAEQQLAGLETGANVVALPVPVDPALVAEATAESRRRLHLLLIVIGGVPESCATAAATLRRGIQRELRSLERLRATTTTTTTRGRRTCA